MRQFLVVIAVLGLAGCALAAISGSAHDFSANGWANQQICLPCHTPHNADLTVADSPLWNHAVTTATFQIYASGTLDATVAQPAGASKLCLSCHDGSVAVDSFGGATGTTLVTGGALVGTDLRNDHPISFTYDATLATTDGGLHDPATTNSGLGGTISHDMLQGGRMECSSCHDVHNQYNQSFLLLKSNNASALCLTCHNK
jgi:predicted CXXCH cytochrome family protein